MSINLLPNAKTRRINKKLMLIFSLFFLTILISFLYQFDLRTEIKQQQRKISSLQQQNKLLHQADPTTHTNKKTVPNEKNISLQSQHIALQYAKANDIATLLQNKVHHFISDQGAAVADVRTNALWIKDTPENLSEIQKFVKSLDIPSPQILITAKIVDIDENSIQNLGIKLGMVNLNSSNDMSMDLPSDELQAGCLSLAIAKTQGKLLEMELNALETEGHANVVSNPKLLTENHQTATIESGQEIPYQEQTASGATNTAFKKAVLSLKVTPEMMLGNKLLLTLSVNQDKISSLSVNGVPAIDTEQLSTQVEVENNQTIILGGIYQEDTHVTTEQVPFLSKLPGVGTLFRSKETSREKRELLIFVTPSIVENKYSGKSDNLI